jgi:DNA-binding CsgD family transcriptional regulator
MEVGHMRGRFVEELASIIGADATLALIEAKGGRRVHVPSGKGGGVSLARIIGAEAAGKLHASFGGMDIKVPIEAGWRIRLYRSRGLSYSEIAKKVGVTEKTVWANLRAANLTNRLPIQARASERLQTRRKVAEIRRELSASAAKKARQEAAGKSPAADARALRLRRAGNSYRAIGEALSVSAESAKSAVLRAMEREAGTANPLPAQVAPVVIASEGEN